MLPRYPGFYGYVIIITTIIIQTIFFLRNWYFLRLVKGVPHFCWTLKYIAVFNGASHMSLPGPAEYATHIVTTFWRFVLKLCLLLYLSSLFSADFRLIFRRNVSPIHATGLSHPSFPDIISLITTFNQQHKYESVQYQNINFWMETSRCACDIIT